LSCECSSFYHLVAEQTPRAAYKPRVKSGSGGGSRKSERKRKASGAAVRSSSSPPKLQADVPADESGTEKVSPVSRRPRRNSSSPTRRQSEAQVVESDTENIPPPASSARRLDFLRDTEDHDDDDSPIEAIQLLDQEEADLVRVPESMISGEISDLVAEDSVISPLKDANRDTSVSMESAIGRSSLIPSIKDVPRVGMMRSEAPSARATRIVPVAQLKEEEEISITPDVKMVAKFEGSDDETAVKQEDQPLTLTEEFKTPDGNRWMLQAGEFTGT
jgi:hypothetical protein